MSKLNWNTWRLAAKLTVVMTLLVALVVTGISLLSITREQQSLRSDLAQQSLLMLDMLAVSEAERLYFLDAEFLSNLAERLSSNQQKLVLVRFYDPQGRIIADAHEPELTQRLEADPFGQRLVATKAPVMEWQATRVIAGRSVFFDEQLLGAVSVGLSTELLSAQRAAVRNQGLSIALLAGVAGVILALQISRSITKPLQPLVSAMNFIARGKLNRAIADLSEKIRLESKAGPKQSLPTPQFSEDELLQANEITVLSRSFYNMAIQLRESAERIQTQLTQIQEEAAERKRAQEALQTLNEELEQRVKERTADLELANSEISSLNKQLKHENLRMSTELDIARRLQEMILPRPEEFQQFEDIEIAGFMQPADEIGGDYYDVLSYQNGQLCLGIGDVTGHGLESGVLMLMTQTAIRTLIDRGETDSGIFLNTLNRVLYHNIQRMRAEKSLTLTLVQFRERELTLFGQHEEMLLVRRNGQVKRIDTADLGFPVGLVEDIAHWIGEMTVTLDPGDGIVLYTDGITEAQDPEGQFYGIERLCAVIGSCWGESVEEIKHAIIADVLRFVDKQTIYDDLTLVILKQK